MCVRLCSHAQLPAPPPSFFQLSALCPVACRNVVVCFYGSFLIVAALWGQVVQSRLIDAIQGVPPSKARTPTLLPLAPRSLISHCSFCCPVEGNGNATGETGKPMGAIVKLQRKMTKHESWQELAQVGTSWSSSHA